MSILPLFALFALAASLPLQNAKSKQTLTADITQEDALKLADGLNPVEFFMDGKNGPIDVKVDVDVKVAVKVKVGGGGSDGGSPPATEAPPSEFQGQQR
ncbi:hypothetical protein QR680_014501 [Steinernema hermaphroditum]|uniref:Uncharacterized protein n=1 Tax=Steinernema hermaphroditum TaxID=289476 RepID=A0AA39IBC7_9BILA|nr:hypothetical protein QR680_014501 [Steinernema hermaphroditum]